MTEKKTAKNKAKNTPVDPKATLTDPTCPKCKATIKTVCVVGASCPECKTRLGI